MKYLKEFATQQEYEAYINGNPDLPNVSLVDDDESVKYKQKPDYSKQYLTLVPSQNGSFRFEASGLSYSLDEGETWTSLERNTFTPTVYAGKKIMWKGELTPTSDGIGKFYSTIRYEVEGNAMSLLFGDNFVGQTDLTEKNYAFRYLFQNQSGLISVERLVLPATKLAYYCYANMFKGCSSLTTAPVLPATTLANNCYMYMFSGCTSLTTAPELPATTMAESCYEQMFKGCSSLTTAPVLPATTLAKGCYSSIFEGCTSLTTAPELPATTLAQQCYKGMFVGCTSLTTAPALSATTLANYCYQNMFTFCSNINYIKMLGTSIGTNSLANWVNGVQTVSGTFVKAASQTSLPSGASGIPENWTVQNI